MDYQQMQALSEFLKSGNFEKETSLDILDKFLRRIERPIDTKAVAEAYGYIKRQRERGFPIKGSREGENNV